MTHDPPVTAPLVSKAMTDLLIEALERHLGECSGALESAEKEIAALRADAQRYRHLRSLQNGLFVINGTKDRVKLGTDCPFEARLDEIIDAEMNQKAPA
jgi:hypothetical protein